ncbi:MAG: hypothetical protein J0L61_06320 [Planctomycetes bacterium]|nr:hypothetical protein [Planctomycetota bacterium]
MKSFALSALAIAAASSTAFGAFTITDGNATMTSSNTPNFPNSTLSTADFRPEGGTSTDHLFYYNWSYRALSAGSTGIQSFSNLTSPTVVQAGNTVTFTWSNNGPGSLGSTRFDAVLTMVITDGPVTGHAKMDATLVFTAASTNTAPTNWSIFNGHDFDVSGTTGSDAVTVNNTSAVEYTQTDTATGFFAKAQGFGASRYQVGGSSTIRNLLTGGGLTNLNNTASAAAGDNAGAFQWDVSGLAPGASVTIQSSFLVAPTPGAAGLLGLAGLTGLRRRRA